MTPPDVSGYADNADSVGRGLTMPVTSVSTIQPPDSPGLTINFTQWLFERFKILKSSSVRIGLTFWLLFVSTFAVAEWLFYENLQERILSRIDQSIIERHDAIKGIYNSKGLDAVIEVVQSRENLPMSTAMGSHLATADGGRIAGNIPICLTELGWDDLVAADIGLDSDSGSYRFYTVDLGGNLLSIGRSLYALEDLRVTFVESLVRVFLGSMLLAILVSWYIAWRMHVRVQGLSGALDNVAAGNLSARLPVSWAEDDIDQMSMKVNAALVRLKQTVDGLRQVSTDIAHDLKTPLNRLYISIEEAASKSRGGACVGDELEHALLEAHGINSTFEALLRIAQIEAGARKSQFKFFDLASVIETTAEVYAPVIEEHGHTLIMDFNPAMELPMFGDKELVLQLIVNLVENSMNHCEPGAEIHFAASEHRGYVWLSVADTGPGIPEAERENVFRRLYRLERSRTTRGTGLGLSLVKAIADLHCGKVFLEDNEPGLKVIIQFDRDCPIETQ